MNTAFDEFLNDIKAMEEDNLSSSKVKEVCRLILDDKYVVICDEIILNDAKYELKYGIISSNSFKYTIGSNKEQIGKYNIKTKYGFGNLQGVSTYHHNRGIDIGP
ncbi:MAG: hypothetical protein RSE41_09685 [Clostridia bacterium]